MACVALVELLEGDQLFLVAGMPFPVGFDLWAGAGLFGCVAGQGVVGEQPAGSAGQQGSAAGRLFVRQQRLHGQSKDIGHDLLPEGAAGATASQDDLLG